MEIVLQREDCDGRVGALSFITFIWSIICIFIQNVAHAMYRLIYMFVFDNNMRVLTWLNIQILIDLWLLISTCY